MAKIALFPRVCYSRLRKDLEEWIGVWKKKDLLRIVEYSDETPLPPTSLTLGEGAEGRVRGQPQSMKAPEVSR
jgi:hypothetical protein